MKFVALLLSLVVLGGAQARPAVPAFRHIVVIVFENKEVQSVLGNADAPTFNTMARRYATLSRYYGVSHPSLPNYLALVSGSTFGIHSDCTTCLVSARNLADTLARARKKWKVYAEDLPKPGFTGAYSGGYAKKHNPFVYFKDVVASPARLAQVVPFGQLRADLDSETLPDFALVVPNQCHSMHDCSVSVGDAWLSAVLPPLLKLPGSAVFVVFDEGDSNARGGGHVAALALGQAVRPGARFTAVTSHYGLLRTIEAAWKLPLLGNSARATPITKIWR